MWGVALGALNDHDDGKWLTLDNKITKRSPVTHLSELATEVTEIKKLLKEIKLEYEKIPLAGEKNIALPLELSLLVRD